MSPFRAIPRAPQATITPPAGSSTNGPRTSSATRGTTTTWDTRVGSVVYSTYQPAQTTSASADDSGSSGGLLSSKPGVAGLCAGIAVICILVAAFFIYRVKFRQHPGPKQTKVAAPKSSSPTLSRFSKKPPSPFQLGSRTRHPLEDGFSRSTSSVRSPRPSHLSSSRAPPTERFHRAGDVMEISPIRYQHTNSSVTRSATTSTYAHTRQRSDSGAISAATISEYTPYSLPSRSLERLSTATDTRFSMLDSSSYTSRTHLLAPSQVLSNAQDSRPVIPARRPLPTPPHPPPSYDQVSGSRPMQIMSTIPDTEGKYQSYLDAEADVLTPSTLVGAQSPDDKAEARARTRSLNESRRSNAPTLAGPTPVTSPVVAANFAIHGDPAFLRRSVEDTVLDMELAMTPRSHRRHPSSGDQDPFITMNYDLPVWLGSDPYPAQPLRPSISQPSLDGGAGRSVAASSRVLPSDSSTRTLTPELTSLPIPALPANAFISEENIHPAPHSPIRSSQNPPYTSTSAAPSTRPWPLSAIEGDGPPVDEVLVYHGAERPGWAESSPLPSASSTSSRTRGYFPADRFEVDDLHPTTAARLDGRYSAIIANINTVIPGASVTPNQELTFMSLTPLSSAMPIQGKGLSRAFSVDSPSPHRKLLAPSARGFGRMAMARTPTAPTLDRSVSTLSSFQGAGMTTGTLSVFEEQGSMAPSSGALPPSEAVSIRSISPETGWIGYPESAEGDDRVRERGLETIDESVHGHQQQPSPATPRVAPVRDAAGKPVGWGRASKSSLGEDGVLWG